MVLLRIRCLSPDMLLFACHWHFVACLNSSRELWSHNFYCCSPYTCTLTSSQFRPPPSAPSSVHWTSCVYFSRETSVRSPAYYCNWIWCICHNNKIHKFSNDHKCAPPNRTHSNQWQNQVNDSLNATHTHTRRVLSARVCDIEFEMHVSDWRL